MRYLVTGATGFIGGSTARQLRAAGHDVTALVRDPARAGDLEQRGVRLVSGTITDRDAVRSAMAGADGVYHIAGWYHVGKPDWAEAVRTNVDGTRTVFEVMRDLGIPRGVYTSTLAVFSDTKGRMVDESYRFTGKHLSVYDETKARAHYEVVEPLQKAGVPIVTVQPGVVVGPGDTSAFRTLLTDYLTLKLRGIPRGVAYCLAHVEDIARAHLLAMERGRAGESYIIAGERAGLDEVFAEAERISGVKPPSFRPSAGFLRFLAMVTRNETYRVGAGVTYLGDNGKARRELGYDPRPWRQALRESLLHEMHILGLKPPG